MNNESLEYNSIAILYGGTSRERDISLLSGENAYMVLKNNFEDVRLVDVGMSLSWCDELRGVEFVFNMLHGEYGEDGRVQSVLDMMGLKYNTCCTLSSAICFDKSMCSRVLRNCMSGCMFFPEELVLYRYDASSLALDDGFLLYRGEKTGITMPCIVKPNNSGSSVGLALVSSDVELDRCMHGCGPGEKILVQEYINGIEVTGVVVAGEFIGAIHADYSSGDIFDYEQKYSKPYKKVDLKGTKIYDLMRYACLEIYKVLMCSGMVRVDFIYSETLDKLYFLEVNSQPGFSAGSIVPAVAEMNGRSQLDILLAQM